VDYHERRRRQENVYLISERKEEGRRKIKREKGVTSIQGRGKIKSRSRKNKKERR
jgi:hypothetical protein